MGSNHVMLVADINLNKASTFSDQHFLVILKVCVFLLRSFWAGCPNPKPLF
jgi:hypothetical protein